MLTKLDGTAKGGIVFQVQRELGVPVKLVGLGEGADDLAPFEPGGVRRRTARLSDRAGSPGAPRYKSTKRPTDTKPVQPRVTSFTCRETAWARVRNSRHTLLRRTVAPDRWAAAMEGTRVPDVANSGDTAWMLASAALVLLMTPGLAFFYGGMVRRKSVLNMMMMNFSAMAVVGVLWVLYGYSMAFGNDIGGGLSATRRVLRPQRPSIAGYAGTGDDIAGRWRQRHPATGVRRRSRLMFAIITVGPDLRRDRRPRQFGPLAAVRRLWATIVYFPVAHWVFAFDGVDAPTPPAAGSPTSSRAIDFAGGTAVHINAGAAGLALAIVLGKRRGWPREPMRPHNLPLVHARRRPAVVRLVRLQRRFGVRRRRHRRRGLHQHDRRHRGRHARLAARRAIRDGKPPRLGAASGVVAGLVAITPACWFGLPGRRDRDRRHRRRRCARWPSA